MDYCVYKYPGGGAALEDCFDGCVASSLSCFRWCVFCWEEAAQSPMSAAPAQEWDPPYYLCDFL
jgi:hypothetical protein